MCIIFFFKQKTAYEIALALADAAGIARPLPAGFGLEPGDEVFDLHEARDLAALEHAWLLPASPSLARGELQQLAPDFADGRGWIPARAQRWRFRRRPRVRAAPSPAHGRATGREPALATPGPESHAPR